MVRKVVDLILLAAIVVGGVFAWQSGRERARLHAEAVRLSRKAGDLPIGDPNRAHVAALETGEPLHFAWRIYMPANAQQMVRYDSDAAGGSSNMSWASVAKEFIARVRFRENDRGELEIYGSFGGGSSRFGFGRPELADRLRGRWDEVGVEQVGRGDVVALAPDRPTTLLRLTLPEDLRGEAEQLLWSYDPERPEQALYELELRYAPATGPGMPSSYSTSTVTQP